MLTTTLKEEVPSVRLPPPPLSKDGPPPARHALENYLQLLLLMDSVPSSKAVRNLLTNSKFLKSVTDAEAGVCLFCVRACVCVRVCVCMCGCVNQTVVAGRK